MPHTPLTIIELISANWTCAKVDYVNHGKPISEVITLHCVTKRLKEIWEAIIANKDTVCYTAIEHDSGADITRERCFERALLRRTINKPIGRIKRVLA